jgi:D-tyrosyl-tRNA(Tyr) deacylase
MVRAVAQRVRSASVSVEGNEIARIQSGLAILLGIGRGDTPADVKRMASKVAVMRVFEDAAGKMNLSTSEAGGEMLVVSQFTLYADLTRGRRPSFVGAADPEIGNTLYRQFQDDLRGHGYSVASGEFGAEMVVSLENDGPVTIILDSDAL